MLTMSIPSPSDKRMSSRNPHRDRTRTVVNNRIKRSSIPDHSELEDYEERDGAINELHLDVDAFHSCRPPFINVKDLR